MASPARQRIAPAIPLSKYANVQSFTPSPQALRVVKAADQMNQEQRLARKVDQFNRYADRLEAAIAREDAFIRAHQKRKARLQTRYDAAEDRCICEMQAGGFDSIHGRRTELKLRPAPLALRVTDESAIPEDYIRTTISTAVDKVGVKAALQRGEEIAGVSLTQKVSLVRK